ncbi:MAG: hypothetical protein P1U89_00290 [Verrucomicrobiales bacterium]|nr:hypothetical protein [Verrucomicrobiales bacterium]
MDNSKPSPEEILEFCDVITEDDGVSPFELEKQKRKQNHQSNHSTRSRHRLKQLCRQVQRGIDDAFLCDCGDPLLSDLRTIEVTSVAGSSALCATVLTEHSDPETLSLIYERLLSARGLIRSSVAAMISRKRIPQIQFKVLPAPRD